MWFIYKFVKGADFMKIKNIFIAMMLVFSITSCDGTTTSTNEFEETTQWNVNYYYNYEGNSGVYKTVSTNGLCFGTVTSVTHA